MIPFPNCNDTASQKLVRGVCFTRVSSTATWAQASFTCANMGGFLASIRDDDDQIALTDLGGNVSNWIGLKSLGGMMIRVNAFN